MAENTSCRLYREVYVPFSGGNKWKDITLNTGASASTLQDIKVAESCGGYTYKDSGQPNSSTRNRYIYWKACNDTLELVEESLDIDLYASTLRLHFQDTAILGGVSIHESHGYVIILVPTVASVHRLIFPHPSKLQKADLGYGSVDQLLPSIFHDASIAKFMDTKNMHMLNPGGSITSHFHTAATFYTTEGEALFGLASNSGSILLVKMPPLGIQGIVQQVDLCQSSVMQKLWTGLVPSVIRGGQDSSHVVCSLTIHPVRGEACIFAVCKDHRLKIWSCKSHECTLVCNLLDYLPEGNSMQSTLPAGSGHTIRKLVTVNQAAVKFVVHLNFPTSNQFCILQPQIVSGRLQISHVASIFGHQDDLIDFSMTPVTLVTLWTSSEGQPVVRTLPIGEEGPGSWSEVLLQPSEIAELSIPAHRDPREVYLERLFQPGRFSKQDIRRALSVYSQSLEPTMGGEMSVNVNTLKQDVTIAVETEIRRAAVDYELQEDDYYQLQLEQWTKFYSCCIQYHEVAGKMKGLFVDSVTGLVALIRKGCVSYLRPCDNLEELYYNNQCVDPTPLFSQLNIPQEYQLQRDVRLLFESLQIISMEMSADLASQFEHELSTCHNLSDVAGQLVDSLILANQLEDDEGCTSEIVSNLKCINDIVGAVRLLLGALDLSDGIHVDGPVLEQDVSAMLKLSLTKLFTSQSGVQILCASMEQFAQTRFNILRDLCLLQETALRLGDQVDIGPQTCGHIRNDLLQQNTNLLRAYLVVKWSSHTVAASAPANTLEMNIRLLSSLDITDSLSLSNPVQGNISAHQRLDNTGASLMEMFIQGSGGELTRTRLAQSSFLYEDPNPTWTQGINGFIKHLASFLWPISDTFDFPEFLVSSCQYLALQDYLGLLQQWCEYNAASRCFLTGLAYLHFDEPVKAAQCFSRARDGVAEEGFLRYRFLQSEETNVTRLEVLYYLKVIKQFEEFSAPDVVISLARTAIGLADDDDPNLPTLWSKVFKYELELGHNTEAYNAMIENPDPSRRKDCLRQLLIHLCDRGDLQSLVDFPYTDLEEEVETILESRARCMDLTTHNYYDLLYAFHIFRNNYRKAGSVMYEHGMRLGWEVPGRQGLQRQAQCYLAALNALRLVKPEYSWIIKPLPAMAARSNTGAGEYGKSPKHSLMGDELQVKASKFEILELEDIEKEFMLVDARLKLLSNDPDPALAAGMTPGADEMVGLLVKSGMYDRAIILCRAFDIPLYPVFDSLALRCVNLAEKSSYYMRGDNEYTSQAWNWLQDNNLTLNNMAKECSSTDQAWHLLQQYLDRYEDNTAHYHRCTATKLLSHGFTLPTWFINSYKGLNAAELLRLYIDYDLLEEGVSLSIEYIDAVMETFRGQDSHLYQLKGCLRHLPQTVWLPYSSIDLLLKALSDSQQTAMHEALKDKLTQYMGRLRNVTDAMTQQGQAYNCQTEPMYIT